MGPDSEMLIPIVLFICIAAVLWKFFDGRQRVRTIALEKGTVDENFKFLFGTFHSPNRYAALKWGLAATLIGVSLLITIPLQAFAWARLHQGELITGMIFIAGGLAFLLYYMLVAKAERRTGE